MPYIHNILADFSREMSEGYGNEPEIEMTLCTQGDHHVPQEMIVTDIPFTECCKDCLHDYYKSIVEESAVEEIENFHSLASANKF